MREDYDFSNARKNPYVQKEKKQITINLNTGRIKENCIYRGTKEIVWYETPVYLKMDGGFAKLENEIL